MKNSWLRWIHAPVLYSNWSKKSICVKGSVLPWCCRVFGIGVMTNYGVTRTSKIEQWLKLQTIFYQDWFRAKEVQWHNNALETASDRETWSPPPQGFMKCNVDASFRQQANLNGMGLCIRDYIGKIVAIRTNFRHPCLPVLEGSVDSCFNNHFLEHTRTSHYHFWSWLQDDSG